jgi:hypothetical protein
MALTKCDVQGNIIGSLGTTPQERGLTTQEFKDKFDEMPEGIKEYINNVLTAELDAHIADYMSHKADNTAHNGFAGNAKSLLGLTDFNTFTATGLYHGVLTSVTANEPITTASARRITLINMAASDGPAAMQMLIYADGYNAGNLYVRSRQGIWGHIASV